MSLLLINGNSLHIPLADESVQMVVTSPPYWNLRDYQTGIWQGGKEDCDHLAPPRGGRNPETAMKQLTNEGTLNYQYKSVCGKCGAVRVDKQLGNEDLHDCMGWATGNFCGECYICHTLQWTREIKRILRKDGTFWLNIGDSYNGSGGAGGDYNVGGLKEGQPKYSGRNGKGLKPKDLVGIPWRVAFALQNDGWYLRSDIIWNKTNPMPESAQDRPTKAHEYIFLLAKSREYYYDAMAIAEEAVWTQQRLDLTRGFAKKDNSDPHPQHHGNMMTGRTMDGHSGPINTDGSIRAMGDEEYPVRNKRSVWTLSTKPYQGAHFATYPPDLIEPCIKAGTSEKGCCPFCGKTWERITERHVLTDRNTKKNNMTGQDFMNGWADTERRNDIQYETTGWDASCACGVDPIPCIVFDPFVGSGTTLEVARKLGRHGIGLDLSLDYLTEQASERLNIRKMNKWLASSG